MPAGKGCCGVVRMLTLLLLLATRRLQVWAGTCPGTVEVQGHGTVSLINAMWNVKGQAAGTVTAPDGHTVQPHMNGRTYWGESCTEGKYDNQQFSALKLLGKTLRYTSDMSTAGCGCNAALYLTSLHQNSLISDCEDHYCDANSVCGVRCAEIDIQEANQNAWHSTLHTQDDGEGVGQGIGGKLSNWAKEDYAPGGKCIDTTRPFEVSVSFPTNSYGGLAAMHLELTQKGSPCPLSASLDSYDSSGRDGIAEMSAALALGMTPIISFWASDNMLWMDGVGSGGGECGTDSAASCPDSVKFYNFSIQDTKYAEPFCEKCPMGSCDRHADGTCEWFSGEWLKGLESYHCKVDTCDGVPVGEHFSKCWSWKKQKYFSIKDRNHPCVPAPTSKPTPEPVRDQILDVVHILMMWKVPGFSKGSGASIVTVVVPTVAAAVTGLAIASLALATCRRATAESSFRRLTLESRGEVASDSAMPVLQGEAGLDA